MKILLVLLVVAAYSVSFSASEIKVGPGQIRISGNFSTDEDKKKTFFNLAAGMKGEQGMKGETGEPGPPGVLDPETRANLTAEIKKELLKCAFRSSCKELHEFDPTLRSGYHEIWTPQGVKKVYCEMNDTNCSGDAGWMRVVKIDANSETYSCTKWKLAYTKRNKTCLPDFEEECPSGSISMCIRSDSVKHGCSTVKIPTHGLPYTKVCGRAKGYQLGNVSAFHSEQDLESAYVSGLSVTHGAPGNRSHIWTFAAGYSKKAFGNASLNCPCAINKGPNAPEFVGNNSFCESGNFDERQDPEELPDILWDSEKCPPESSCCARGAPWFNTTLTKEEGKENKAVRDDIEVRLCQYPFENVPANIGVEELEIYIY